MPRDTTLRETLQGMTHMAVTTQNLRPTPTNPTGVRSCYYCHEPAPTAFYLQELAPLRAWACAPCYVQYYVPVHGGQRAAG